MAPEALVSASTVVMNSVIKKLLTLMGEEYRKQTSMQREVAFLKEELSSMNAVLEELANMEEELDPQTMVWRNKVMDMAFDMEDCIDDFMHQVAESANSGDVGFVGKITRWVYAFRDRRHFASQIQQLKTRIKDVNECRKRYKTDKSASSSSSVSVDPRLPALYTEAANLVGMEGPKQEVTKLLGEEVQHLRVVSIVGFGGLGKTTLANQLYREVGGQYDCKAFVSVSERPDMMKLLRMIILEIKMPQLSHTYEIKGLIDNIREYLRDKRYLFVIDDIWDELAWKNLRCAFPDNQQGSKVIITTRIETVATACCNYRHEFTYKMKPLDDDNSRNLFFSRFGQDCLQSFIDISGEILQKCGGLPLAIISIASLLASQPTRSVEQWNYVCHSLSSNLRTNPTLEGMRQVLQLSYNNLPRHLKTCLLYIGIYPEDYTIKKDDLVRQWVAEGFVSEIHGRDAEEVAGSYFNELVNRSMIQPGETWYDGKVWSCKVHDLILDLIRLKCEEENFLRVVDNLQGLATALQSKVRRLSLQLDNGANEGAAAASLSMSHIRSLALFGDSHFKLHVSAFKSIRVLYLDSGYGGKALAQKEEENRYHENGDMIDLTPICKLFQLRYLNVRGKVRLPKLIRGLQLLQTLELTEVITAIPSDIVHLPCLSHLYICLGTRLPNGYCKMKSLRTLAWFIVDENSENLEGLGELTNLRDLTIEPRGDYIISQQGLMDVFWSSMTKLVNCNLRSLYVRGYPRSSRAVELGSLTTYNTESNLEVLHIDHWMLPRVPSWTCQHHKLHNLALSVKKLMQDDLDLLAGLPSLGTLFLLIQKSPEERIVIHRGAVVFPVIIELAFSCFAPCFTFRAGAMPKLQVLDVHLHACGVERYGPSALEGVEHLLSLRKVDVTISFKGADREPDRRAADAEVILRNAISIHPGHPSTRVDLRDNRNSYPSIPELSSDEEVVEEGAE